MRKYDIRLLVVVLVLSIICIGIGIWLTILICNSGLPLWAKILLLR